MKVRELIKKLQEVKNQDATAVIWSWFGSGERIYRIKYPLNDGEVMNTVVGVRGEQCQIVGQFDDCLADRVQRWYKEDPE